MPHKLWATKTIRHPSVLFEFVIAVVHHHRELPETRYWAWSKKYWLLRVRIRVPKTRTVLRQMQSSVKSEAEAKANWWAEWPFSRLVLAERSLPESTGHTLASLFGPTASSGSFWSSQRSYSRLVLLDLQNSVRCSPQGLWQESIVFQKSLQWTRYCLRGPSAPLLCISFINDLFFSTLLLVDNGHQRAERSCSCERAPRNDGLSDRLVTRLCNINILL